MAVLGEEPVVVYPQQQLGQVRSLLVVLEGRQQLEEQPRLAAEGQTDLGQPVVGAVGAGAAEVEAGRQELVKALANLRSIIYFFVM